MARTDGISWLYTSPVTSIGTSQLVTFIALFCILYRVYKVHTTRMKQQFSDKTTRKRIRSERHPIYTKYQRTSRYS